LGIIQKQAIKGTIYSYFGVIVGFIINVLIYPKVFETDQIGLIRIFTAYTAIFSMLASLGFPRVTTMFFPYFRDYKNKHHGFFLIAFVVCSLGLLIALIVLLAIKPWIIGKGLERSALFAEYFYYLIPLIISALYYICFDNYYKVLYNSVQGTFLKEFMQRVLILGAAILFLLNQIDFGTFVLLFLLSFLIPTVILLLLLIRDKQLFFNTESEFISKDLRKKMISVGLYGILTSFSGILALNIDTIMINSMLNLSDTGIYAITFFFGTVILIPSRPLLKISSVIIADSWKKNDFETINKIYYKSCLNQLIFACLILIGIWGNIHNLFNEYLLKPVFEPGKYVILFISIASLIQMAGGTSNMILFTSKKYKTHTFFMVILVGLIILTNYIFIPIFGIVGAAIASALSFLIFNLIKYFYLNKKFGFRPYDFRSLLVLLFTILTYGASLALPKSNSFVVDIIIRSLFITVLYLCLIIGSRVSTEINQKFDAVLVRLKIKK
jgi:O-antigen/teichoic acid export membrane protein